MDCSNELISIIDTRINKVIRNNKISAKYSATVVDVGPNDVGVVISGDDKVMRFLNQSGSSLSNGDNVYVEAIGGDLTNGVITNKFGVRSDIGGNSYVNQNILINWDFSTPINQRGKTSYSTGYSIDCWKLNGGTLTIKDDCIEVESPPESFVTLECSVEFPSKYSMKTITMSALAERISGTEYCYITNVFDVYKKDVAIPDSKAICSLTDTAGTLSNYLKFVFVCGKGCKIRLYSAKMEYGATQTLAYQKTNGEWELLPQPDSDYSTQLLKCQRYQIALWRYFISPAVHFQPNYIDFSIPIPIEMRAIPSLNQSDFIVYADSKGAQSGFTFSVAATSPNAVRVRATKDGHGLTLVDGVRIEVNVERAILDANF